MEGAHGQLGPWFTDGLSSDNANSFPQIHHVAMGQTPAIAPLTNGAVSFTGQG